MKKIRVIEFMTSLTDGGTETLVKDYARLLDKNIFEVLVVCVANFKDTAIEHVLIDEKIPYVKLWENVNILTVGAYHLFPVSFVGNKLKKIIKQYNPDVLHAHLDVLKYVKYCSNELANVRLFYTCHNLPELFFKGKRKDEGASARFLIENNNLRIIALHSDMQEEINNMFHIDNAVVVRNGIDFSRFHIQEDMKYKKRSEIGIPLDAYVIGNVGRFHEQKNHTFLLDVFEFALQQNDKAHLLLVGAGDLRDSICSKIEKMGIENKVTILSNRKDIPEIMKTMDVFAFPSLFEGLGIVLIEAQASNLPCVVSDRIPREAYKTNLIEELSLEDSIETWAEAILDPHCNVSACGDIADYDMNKEIKVLESLYLK